MEGQVAVGALLDRFPDIRLACPVDELRWLPFPVFRGMAELPVVTGSRPSASPPCDLDACGQRPSSWSACAATSTGPV